MKRRWAALWAAIWICLLGVVPAGASGAAAVIQVSLPESGTPLTVFLSDASGPAQQSCTIGNQVLAPTAAGGLTDGSCSIYTTILFDTSTSMPTELRQAALEVLQTLIADKSPYDAYRLAVFQEDVTVLQDFTTDRYDLSESAETIQFDGQLSKLYDAVYQSLSHGEPEGTVPAFYRTIVISDGLDDTPDGITSEELFFHLQSSYYPVDVISVSGDQGEVKELAAIARISGGRYTALTAESDPAAAAQSLSLAGYSYVQLSVPQALLDGATRQISVGSAVADVKFPAVELVQEPTPSPSPTASPQPSPTAAPVTQPDPSLFSQWYFLPLAGGCAALAVLLVVLLALRRRGKKPAPAAPAETPPAPSVPSRDGPTVHVDGQLLHTIRLHNVKLPEQVWNLPIADTLTIGRAEHCEIRLSDSSVSREQCRLTTQNGAVTLIPLNTTNQTRCNGRPITVPWPLQSGDVLKFGHVSLMIDAIQTTSASDTDVFLSRSDPDKTQALLQEHDT